MWNHLRFKYSFMWLAGWMAKAPIYWIILHCTQCILALIWLSIIMHHIRMRCVCVCMGADRTCLDQFWIKKRTRTWTRTWIHAYNSGPHNFSHNFYRNVSLVVCCTTDRSFSWGPIVGIIFFLNHILILFCYLWNLRRTENACENHNNFKLRTHKKKKNKSEQQRKYMRHEDEKLPKLLRIAREICSTERRTQ